MSFGSRHVGTPGVMIDWKSAAGSPAIVVRALVAGQRAVDRQLVDVHEAVAVGVSLDVEDRVDDRLAEVELLLDRGAVRVARAGALPAQVADAAGVEVVAGREAVDRGQVSK